VVVIELLNANPDMSENDFDVAWATSKLAWRIWRTLMEDFGYHKVAPIAKGHLGRASQALKLQGENMATHSLVPPFTRDTAVQKVRLAEDNWIPAIGKSGPRLYAGLSLEKSSGGQCPNSC
jgi:hypothetical protein